MNKSFFSTLNKTKCPCGTNHFSGDSDNFFFLSNVLQQPLTAVSTTPIDTVRRYIGNEIDDFTLLTNKMEVLFPSGLCPYYLYNIILIYASNEEQQYGDQTGHATDVNGADLPLLLSVFRDMIQFLKNVPSDYTNPFKTISTMNGKVVDTVNQYYLSGCICGHAHKVNGKNYDYAFEINGTVVGIDLHTTLLRNLVRICDELHVGRYEVMHIYRLLYDAFYELDLCLERL